MSLLTKIQSTRCGPTPGINGEDITLRPGELVHINQSYPYQLCNDTDGVTVLYQVATRPPKPSKIGTYILPEEFQPAD